MSKVSQIQSALLAMNSGAFHELADAYLVACDFGRINSHGSVLGAEKEKVGTPDTLFTTPQGTFVLAEYTTQKDGLFGKIKSDLGKCLDSGKTGIPLDKVERIVCCFTGRITAEEECELREQCRECGIPLDLIGIDAITNDLHAKHPALAAEFLGISIDSGQIIGPDQFVSILGRNRLSTRLDHAFHFREQELDFVQESLEDNRLVILTGRPGVGKTRLALEACNRFKQRHPAFEIHCVLGRNRDLWDDLCARFSRPGHFLLLVDDANRVNRFDYVIDFLEQQREGTQIKVVATVRDYAISVIQDAARRLGEVTVRELGGFSQNQIRALVADEYEINNFLLLDRIGEVSKGNPRLAIMAADVAKQGRFDDIFDVSSLYEEYFSSIRADLRIGADHPESAELLCVAAITSFFNAVDRSNEQMMHLIETSTGISPTAFWDTVRHLHRMEVVDLYDGEVVRVSDQILGTYLFYLAVFKERVVRFDVLMAHMFPAFRARFTDSIHSVVSAFDGVTIINAMQPCIVEAVRRHQAAEDETAIIQLLDVFWFACPTETLEWIRGSIAALAPEPFTQAHDTTGQVVTTGSLPSIMNLLRNFAYAKDEDTQSAVELLLRYISIRPVSTSHLIKILNEDFGFRYDSITRRFSVQRIVVAGLCGRLEKDPVLAKVFMAVARTYLGTHFDCHESRERNLVNIIDFDLTATPELLAIRSAIWQQLISLYACRDVQDEVLEVIHDYSFSNIAAASNSLVQADAEHVLPFLASVLDERRFKDCELMNDYLDLLIRHAAAVPVGLRERFQCATYVQAKTLCSSRWNSPYPSLSTDDYEQWQRKQVDEYAADLSLEEFATFLERCVEIRETPWAPRAEYQVRPVVERILLSLAARSTDLFRQALKLYLERGDVFGLSSRAIVLRLVEDAGCHGAMQVLKELEFPTSRRWLFLVHEVLDAADIDQGVLSHLYGLYESAKPDDLPERFDYLLKYIATDPAVVFKVVSTIVQRAQGDPNLASALTSLFEPGAEVFRHLREFFADDMDLLKRAYLLADGVRIYLDYHGQVFELLLDHDPGFLAEYLMWRYAKAPSGWISKQELHKDYTFIWKRTAHQDIMDRAVQALSEQATERHLRHDALLTALFDARDGNAETAGRVVAQQNEYLLELVKRRAHDSEFMRYVFGVITAFDPKRRLQFVKRFVENNQSVAAFQQLPLEPTTWSWSGSRVPILQGQIDYWDSLAEIMDSVDLLPHKEHIRQKIRGLREQIEVEKRRDFIED